MTRSAGRPPSAVSIRREERASVEGSPTGRWRPSADCITDVASARTLRSPVPAMLGSSQRTGWPSQWILVGAAVLDARVLGPGDVRPGNLGGSQLINACPGVYGIYAPGIVRLSHEGVTLRTDVERRLARRKSMRIRFQRMRSRVSRRILAGQKIERVAVRCHCGAGRGSRELIGRRGIRWVRRLTLLLERGRCHCGVWIRIS